MVEGTLIEPTYVSQLQAALQDRFAGAEIAHERIRDDRYRFVIISDHFENMGHPERQRIVWDIADATVSKADLLKVGMIITMAPSEVPADE